MKDYKPYLLHILDETDYLIKHSSNIGYESFVDDETLRRSFIRSIEIIGEAVKKLPEDLKNKYSSTPWKKIAGIRDILIHEYFGVNYKLVWDVVTTMDIQCLKYKCTLILQQATRNMLQTRMATLQTILMTLMAGLLKLLNLA